MQKRMLQISGAGLVILLAIQLVPYGRNATNPPVVREPAWDSPTTAHLVDAACYDCHSNETRRPWYSRIAPGSWLLERDVRAGRDELNFSDIDNEDNDLDKLIAAVAEGEMPPRRYSVLHDDARLSEAERAALIEGFRNSLPAESLGD